MTSSLSNVRNAIQSEIKQLRAELAKLEKVLSQLGDSGDFSDPAIRGSTGKRKYTRRQRSGEQDVSAALKLIEKAGKGGIKAIKLAHEIKKAGGDKPSKVDLLATEKVKMTGKGGGSTYIYIG
ncbi:MAG: hypothetical protein JWM57_2594 [Phycisphaerales bacterium]|nr:hypothetical protein [Phycisphaerales bacterium]